MQYCEFRQISLVDILEFKQPTRMKFQSVSDYVINYMCSLERHFMICLQPMSFAKNLFQQLKSQLTQGLKASYSLCKQEYSTSICNSQNCPVHCQVNQPFIGVFIQQISFSSTLEDCQSFSVCYTKQAVIEQNTTDSILDHCSPVYNIHTMIIFGIFCIRNQVDRVNKEP